MPEDFEIMLGGKSYIIQSITEEIIKQREY